MGYIKQYELRYDLNYMLIICKLYEYFYESLNIK